MEVAIQMFEELKTQLGKLNDRIDQFSPRRKEILTYEETMELLQCSRSFLDSLRREGLVKVYRPKGRLYCKYSEIMEMLDQQLMDERKNNVNRNLKKKPASRA